MQRRRLEAINTELVKRHLIPLKRLGNYRNGEEELVDIISFIGENPWFVLVQFRALWPYTGNVGVRYVRFAVGSDKKYPIVTTTMVNNKVLFTRQHRAAQLTQEESWMAESARQWAASGNDDTFLSRVLAKRDDTKELEGVGGAHALFGRKLSRLLSKPGVELANWDVMNGRFANGEWRLVGEDSSFYAGGAIHLQLGFRAPLEVETLFLDRKLRDIDDPEGARDAMDVLLVTPEEAFFLANDHATMAGLLLLARKKGAIDFSKIK